MHIVGLFICHLINYVVNLGCRLVSYKHNISREKGEAYLSKVSIQKSKGYSNHKEIQGNQK
jgi:hypothetical protein